MHSLHLWKKNSEKEIYFVFIKKISPYVLNDLRIYIYIYISSSKLHPVSAQN